MKLLDGPKHKVITLLVFNTIVSNSWRSFVFMNLWNWFITSNFNMPNITFLNALGLYITLMFVMYRFDYTEDYENIEVDRYVKISLRTIFDSLLILVIGLMIHLIIEG